MSQTIKIGARFRRPGKFTEVYRVTALNAFDRHLVLAEMVNETQRNDTLTIPVSTLQNTSQWRPVVG